MNVKSLRTAFSTTALTWLLAGCATPDTNRSVSTPTPTAPVANIDTPPPAPVKEKKSSQQIEREHFRVQRALVKDESSYFSHINAHYDDLIRFQPSAEFLESAGSRILNFHADRSVVNEDFIYIDPANSKMIVVIQMKDKPIPKIQCWEGQIETTSNSALRIYNLLTPLDQETAIKEMLEILEKYKSQASEENIVTTQGQGLTLNASLPPYFRYSAILDNSRLDEEPGSNPMMFLDLRALGRGLKTDIDLTILENSLRIMANATGSYGLPAYYAQNMPPAPQKYTDTQDTFEPGYTDLINTGNTWAPPRRHIGTPAP